MRYINLLLTMTLTYLAAPGPADVIAEHDAGIVEEQRLHLLEAAERQSLTLPDAPALAHRTAVVVADRCAISDAQPRQLAVESAQLGGSGRRRRRDRAGRRPARRRAGRRRRTRVVGRCRVAVVEAHAAGAQTRPVGARALQHAVGVSAVVDGRRRATDAGADAAQPTEVARAVHARRDRRQREPTRTGAVVGRLRLSAGRREATRVDAAVRTT